jgi:hypothetical protein
MAMTHAGRHDEVLMPEQLLRALDVASTSMHDDDQHRLPLTLRKQIYDALGRKRTKRRYRSRTWLAILASQRVRPIAKSAVPGRVDLIDRWLALATELVEGRIKPDADPIVEFVHPGYTAFVRPYLEDPDFASRFTFNVDCAFRSAAFATFEAIGIEGLSDLEGYPVSLPNGSELPGEQMTDEALVWTGATDTAACAAVAESWNAAENCWGAQRQKWFWDWWLLEAVPEAFALGSKRAR